MAGVCYYDKDRTTAFVLRIQRVSCVHGTAQLQAQEDADQGDHA